jgi:hypothetical protein
MHGAVPTRLRIMVLDHKSKFVFALRSYDGTSAVCNQITDQVHIGDISGSHGDEYEMTVFWDVIMMEAMNICETLVNFYQTARPNNPEDSHPHTRRRKNLKSHPVCLLLRFTFFLARVFEHPVVSVRNSTVYLLFLRQTGENEDGCLLGCSAV